MSVKKKLTKPTIVRHLTNKTKGSCTILRLKQLIGTIQHGSTEPCPMWSCEQCKLMFPRVNVRGASNICPCDAYDSDYLIKRLQEIIRYFPKEKECKKSNKH